MVCYARRATWMSGITLGAIFVSGQAALHLLNVTALIVSTSAVLGGSTLLAGVFYLSFRAVRRKRALAGGCVGCQFTCQHAITEFASAPVSTRSWLVRTVDRDAPARQEPVSTPVPVSVPAPRAPVMLPMPSWPDRPLMHAPSAPEAGQHPTRERERVRVPAGAR
jgi:hypothetical protein